MTAQETDMDRIGRQNDSGRQAGGHAGAGNQPTSQPNIARHTDMQPGRQVGRQTDM